MSTMGDVLTGIKKMLLIEESVARINQDMEGLRSDLRELRAGQAALNGRLSDVEGYLRAATQTPFGDKPRLPGQ